MVPKHIKIREDQQEFLDSLPGSPTNDSEHIRRALDDYKIKIQRENAMASQSPSKPVERSNNGKDYGPAFQFPSPSES